MSCAAVVSAVLMALALGCGGPKAEPLPRSATPPRAPAREDPSPPDAMAPILLGTLDEGHPRPAATPTTASPAKAGPRVEVDEKSRVVRIPVRVSLKAGVVEWLLSSGERHAGMSVFVTDCPAGEVAEALAKIGLSVGQRPQTSGDDRVRPPTGEAVRVSFIAGSGGVETPAESLISSQSGGPPLQAGSWVYVGPQIIREGDTEVNVTHLAGGLVTTNLRDSSALIYWVPAKADEASPYAAAFYGSKAAPQPDMTGVLIIGVQKEK
jgi:hypothetical protein